MKVARHAKILELIDNYDIETQDKQKKNCRRLVLQLRKQQFQGILEKCA